MKKNLSVLLFVCLLLGVPGCTPRPYLSEDFIGLTSAEVVEKYGEFDNTRISPSEDGLYRNGGCGYEVVEAKVGCLGTTQPKLFMVYFDDDGIAYRCAYEAGGVGG